MLSISAPIKGTNRQEYYLQTDRQDYYANSMERPGRWYGTGAARLGLERTVQPDQLRRLFQGFAPDTGQPLVQNAGQAKRQCGWDLTFNAPKSLSVYWALATEHVRRQLADIHNRAVRKALDQVETFAGITRRGPGGTVKERVGLIFAIFEHGTSRAMDPHLHSHAILANLGLRADGTTGALQTRELFGLKMALGKLYREALESALHQLGLATERDGESFRLRDVPQALCRDCSQRRQQIDRTLVARRERGPLASRRAAVDTRPNKRRVSDVDLRARWQTVADAHGWRPQTLGLNHEPVIAQEPHAGKAGERSAEHGQSQGRAPNAQARPSAINSEIHRGVQEGNASREERQPRPGPDQQQGPRQESSDRAPEPRSIQEPASVRGNSHAAANEVDWVAGGGDQAFGTGRDAVRQTSRLGPPEQAPEPGRQEHASDARTPRGRPEHGTAPDTRAGADRQDREPSRGPATQGQPLPEGANHAPGGPQPAASTRTRRAGKDRSHAGQTKDDPRRGREQARTRGKRSQSQRASQRARRKRPNERSQDQRKARRRSRPAKPKSRSRSVLRKLWDFAQKAELVRIERRLVFPNAPRWSPVHGWRLPVVVLGPRSRPWGRVWWSKRIASLEVRVQTRRLVPRTPKWSPFYGLGLPAIRLIPDSERAWRTFADFNDAREKSRPERAKHEEKQREEHQHSH